MPQPPAWFQDHSPQWPCQGACQPLPDPENSVPNSSPGLATGPIASAPSWPWTDHSRNSEPESQIPDVLCQASCRLSQRCSFRESIFPLRFWSFCFASAISVTSAIVFSFIQNSIDLSSETIRSQLSRKSFEKNNSGRISTETAQITSTCRTTFHRLQYAFFLCA